MFKMSIKTKRPESVTRDLMADIQSVINDLNEFKNLGDSLIAEGYKLEDLKDFLSVWDASSNSLKMLNEVEEETREITKIIASDKLPSISELDEKTNRLAQKWAKKRKELTNEH